MGGLLAWVEGLGCGSHDSIRVAISQGCNFRDAPFPPYVLSSSTHCEWKENRALQKGLHLELIVLSSKPVAFWLLGSE